MHKRSCRKMQLKFQRQGKQQNCLELSVSAILTFSIIFSGKERMKLCSKGEQVINYV